MKVEPSGVVFVGSCEIQSERCLAKTSGPVTAIWSPPGRTQVNVCHTCLDEQIRRGEWEIAGARIKRIKQRLAQVRRQTDQGTD